MTRILVLYTGGTIGMDHTPEGLAPVPGYLPRQLDRLAVPGRHVDVIEYPDLIDSSAIGIAHWNRMLDDLRASAVRYDGFVIIHGTDSMAYTASVLAMALEGLDRPVVLTGSQLPLVHPRSDGWSNLADALEAASRPALHEVAIAFDRLLLRGCRARKVDAGAFSGFDSPNCAPLARFGIDTRWASVDRTGFAQASGGLKVHALDPAVRIAPMMLMPGAASSLFGQWLSADGGLDGAVLMSYGNGNAPADPVLLEGVRAATARGAVVVNITQVLRGAVSVGAYAASQPLARAGAVAGADMTPEAALAKLTVLLSTDPQGARARMPIPLAGEMDCPATA